MRSRRNGILGILIILVLAAAAIGAYWGIRSLEPQEASTGDTAVSGKDRPPFNAVKEPLIHYNVFYTSIDTRPWFNNPDDVVTPYVEDKFNLKIKGIINAAGHENKLDILIASNSLPEVMILTSSFVHKQVKKGIAKDLTELLPKYMPEYWTKFVKDEDKPYFHFDDGKIYWVYKLNQGYDSRIEERRDIYGNQSFGGLCPVIREDILEKCGYTFKPFKQVEKECLEQNRVPTEEEMSIEPAIETPEDFYQLLKKIKNLNLKVTGTNQPVIPWSFTWSWLHYSSMFNTGIWKWDNKTGTADGYLGSPGAKDFWRYVRQTYMEGLLDAHFIIQKDVEFVRKIKNGQIAVFMSDEADLNETRKTLENMDSSYVLRPIPWAHEQVHGYYDPHIPAWMEAVIRKDVSDETAIRLLKMWDWMYTDEGYDTLVWGPEEAGLYEVLQGKRVFRDPGLWKAASERNKQEGGPEKYGLHSLITTGDGDLWSKIAACSGGPINAGKRGIDRSYPAVINVFNKFSSFCQGQQAATDASASFGNVGNADKVLNYQLNDFMTGYLPGLISTETTEEFDSLWEDMYRDFLAKTDYDNVKKEMMEWFNMMGNSKDN